MDAQTSPKQQRFRNPPSKNSAATPASSTPERSTDAYAQMRQPRNGVMTTWSEMQSTLSEVELSAASSGNAFSADHARALEDLRKAQIGLAAAWARSEAEDESMGEQEHQKQRQDQQKDDGKDGANRKDGNSNTTRARGSSSTTGAGTNARRSRGDSAAKRGSVSGAGGTTMNPSTLDEETEADILLARRRREANDRYFERVNKGVVDVVEKLEGVAQKMRGLELEAQDLWGDRDSVESGSTVSE